MSKAVSHSLSIVAVLFGMVAAAGAQTPYMVADLIPGSGTSGGPIFLTNVNGTLFFRLNNQFSNGVGLWKSDGTGAGTVLVTSQTPAHAPVAVGATLFFTPGGAQIWKSDGSSGGTVLVKDLVPGDEFGRIDYLGNLNGTLLFTAADLAQLWKSDGTSGGTVLLKDFGSDYVSNPRGGPFVAAGGFAFFSVCTSAGCGLWRTDGTPTGTILLKAFGSFHGPDWLTASGSRVLFAAGDDVAGNELWLSDGTPGGTVMVKDVEPGAGSASPGWLCDVNGVIYFFASGGYTGHNGLWKSNGTAAGTVQVVNDAVAQNTTNVNGTLFFTSGVYPSPPGAELWKSNGTTSGTVLVKDINPTGDAFNSGSELLSFQGRLWFRADAGAATGEELWTSDGTSGGTSLVGDIYPGGSSSTPTQLTAAGERLFFVANDGVHGRELWAVQVPATISIDDPSVLEGNSGASLLSFSISLSAVSSSAVTVNYVTSNGTAAAGTDYTTSSGTFTIPAGVTSKNLVLVVQGDTVVESNETFQVTLSSPVNAVVVKGVGTGTILNDDPPSVATTVTQYRLYHDGTKEHLYTTDLNEYTVLGTVGWIQEGIAYKMLTDGIYGGVATVPLFRMYHPGILQHHWTTDSNETTTLSGTPFWFYEATIGYVVPTQVSGTVPLYRMALASPALHLWTTDLNEYDTLATRGWIKEGIIGYVVP